MNTTEIEPNSVDAVSASNDPLAVARAIAAAKKLAAIRDLGRCAIAGLTACGMIKGATYATVNHEVLWAVGMVLGACFWIVGMWYWKEIDG